MEEQVGVVVGGLYLSDQSNYLISTITFQLFLLLYGDTKTDIIRVQLLSYDNPGQIWTNKTVKGLSQGAEVFLVAVNQGDKEEERAQRDGTSQHSFHQQHCPTAQQEDMDK